MRDDLHKGAPVPPPWRGLIKAAARDADWAVNGTRSAEMAVQSLMNEFSQPLISAVGELISGRQLSLDPSREIENLRQQFQTSTPVSLFLDELKIALNEPGDQITSDFISETIAGVVQECSTRFIRATALHVDGIAPEHTKELTQRIKNLVGKVNVSERASLTAKGSPALKTSAKPPVDLDEGLPLGAGNA